MKRSAFWSFVLLLFSILVTASGCVSPAGPSNVTSLPTGTTGIPAISTGSPIPTTAVLYKARRYAIFARTPVFPECTAGRTVHDQWDRERSVDNKSASLDAGRHYLDNNYSGQSGRDIPGYPGFPKDGFIVPELFIGTSRAYPVPPDHFTVMLNTTSGKAVVTGSKQTAASLLAHLHDAGTYPSTQADYLEQGITSAGNSDTIYFLNGVDAWITIDRIGPVQPGALTVRGSTSLPAGTPLSITVITVNTHPTPKNYDFSHEIAEGNAVVSPGIKSANPYAGIIDTSLLNTGKYHIIVETRDENLQANAMSNVDVIAAVHSNTKHGNYIDWSRLALPTLVVNTTLSPVMLDSGWRIIPPGTQVTNNEVPYRFHH